MDMVLLDMVTFCASFLIAEEIVKASKNDDLLTALPLATLIVDSVKSLEKPN